MTLPILVRACPGGWLVEGETIQPTLFFLSGGRAEAAARELARLARLAGRAVEVRIFDLSGRLAGVIRADAELQAV
jgi:hypothetical protein